jgi:glutaconate CoA-transferase subunit B
MTPTTVPPTIPEILAAAISRSLSDDDVGFTGLATGRRAATYATLIPLFAMQLAQLTHAPGLTCLLAGWCHNPGPGTLTDIPDAEFDPRLLALECDARDLGYPAQYSIKRGDVTVGFSSGAQVDRHGNLNTVAIGRPGERQVRLVGPILVPEHMALFGREIVMMPRHEARAFVEQVDYVAGVGFPGGREGRARLGLPGSGPEWIVTPKCIFAFDDSGLAHVRSIHPGVSEDDVRASTGFVLADMPMPITELPTEAELAILRSLVDPAGLLRADDGASS